MQDWKLIEVIETEEKLLSQKQSRDNVVIRHLLNKFYLNVYINLILHLGEFVED